MIGNQLTNVKIDFEVPQFVIHHYYISGIISFFLNLFVSYLIIFQSGKLDTYRFYLLAFQITCILSDLNITVLMQPIGLFPIPSGYSCGILHRWFSWSTHTLMTLFTLLQSGQIEVLTICFLRKYQAIMNLKNIRNSSNFIYFFFYFLCISYSCSIAISIYVSVESHEEQLRVLDEIYPSFAQKFRTLDEFQLYVYNNKMVVFYILVFGGTTKTAVLVTFLVLRMLKVLKEIQNQLSSATLARHKTALRCLVIQFLTTPIAFFPACLLAITVWLPTENSQKISWLAFMCMTTHSFFNSMVVIITYPEFRRFLFFWKKPINSVTITISSARPSQNNAIH